MFKTTALLFAGIVAASPVSPSGSTNTVAVFNNCEEPIYSWSRATFEGSQDKRKGAMTNGAAIPKGLTIVEPESSVGFSLGYHVSTSKTSYADHNTKDFVFGTDISPAAMTVHVNLLNVYGKPNWFGAVAATAAVECSESGGQRWAHHSLKHYEGKGVVECRGDGNKITKGGVSIGYALCANPKDFMFNEDGELMYENKPLGFKATMF